jgi:hypothetical protein
MLFGDYAFSTKYCRSDWARTVPSAALSVSWTAYLPARRPLVARL